ncbi:MAG: VanZ family protein, partial [Puniceicoccales bacterium]
MAARSDNAPETSPVNPRSPRHHRARWLFPVGLALGISLLSGGTVPPGVVPGIFQIDKLIHVLVFGLLATAVYRALDPAMPPARRALWAIGLTIAFGLSDELHQGTNPNRTMDFADLLADIAGAIVATLVYQRWGLYRRLL